MCPTTLGRIHTRVSTLTFLPAILGFILWAATGKPEWLVLLGIYMLLGVGLDVLVYQWAIKYQPPWMTFVLALAELGLLYAIARILDVNLSAGEAIGYYWAAWLLAIGTKIALLPLVSLTYLESAGEFRREQWSIPPELTPMPILPSATQNGHGAVIKAATRDAQAPGRADTGTRLILVQEGVDRPQEYAVRSDLTIGRTHCDITIDDPAVERRHAVIEHFSSGFGIRPMHSDAAVIVNDQPITGEWVLTPGDRIGIGGARLRVEAADHAIMAPTTNGASGDVPAPDPVPKTVSALVEAAGGPSGEFAPPVHSRRRRRGSAATRGDATLAAFLILLVDAVAITIYLANTP
jgi:pSer/pThr/pTyr-binding forkhead associated (FHA) protein